MENNINRESLSEMDKIFIPKDLDDNVTIGDLANYSKISAKFWRTVPENYCLVTKNVFTQKVSFISGHGLKFIPPIFTKTILVPTIDTTKGYDNIAVTTEDGIEIKTDLKLVMKITDPAKYITQGKNQLGQLDSLIRRLLREYISKKEAYDVIQERVNLDEFDYDDEFVEFEQRYGIKINKVVIEKVELPEHLKKQFNDVAEEREKKKAQAIKLEAQKEKARADAEMMNILAKAEAEKIKTIEEAKSKAYIDKMMKLVDNLKKQGVSTSSIEEHIKTLIVSEKGNAIFMNTGSNSNNISNDVAVGVAAGMKVSDNKKVNSVNEKKELTNVDKLINLINVYTSINGNTNEKLNSLYQRLMTDDKTIEMINGLSEEDYRIIINGAFSNNLIDVESKPKSRF